MRVLSSNDDTLILLDEELDEGPAFRQLALVEEGL